jgi:hypothetical protein
MALEVKTAKNSKLPKLPETILSQLEKVGVYRYPPRPVHSENAFASSPSSSSHYRRSLH